MLVEEMKGARKVIETCAKVQPGEEVLVITDWPTFSVAERVAAAAGQAGAEVVMTVMTAREHDGNEPPASVARAMSDVDVMIIPVQRSISHSKATEDALNNDVRRISMVGFTPEQLYTGGINCDFEAAAPLCEAMAERLTEADEARVTCPNGSDATFDLSGRSGLAQTGLADEPGKADSIVHVEANISPVDGAVSGRLVFDGSVPNLDIGVLENDIVIEVEDGTVTSIDGGWEADRIRETWERYDVPAVYNIAQLAVGMNPECEDFNGWFTNEHGVYGSLHVGIGTSTILGGVTRAPVHFDAMMREPTLALDGDVVLEDREFHL